MAPRPGMPHMAPAPAAGAIPSRPVAPAAQPAVTKPLFPSAAQVGSLLTPPSKQYVHRHTFNMSPSLRRWNLRFCVTLHLNFSMKTAHTYCLSHF